MEFGQVIVRGVQLLWLILLTALLGNVIASNINGHMSAINFALFATVISWLACIFGFAAAFVGSLSSGIFAYIPLGLDGLSVLFTFIAAIVLPAKLHAVNCGGSLTVQRRGVNWIGFGSNDDEKRCRELQASTAFLWFLFATLAASTALSAMASRRYGGGGSMAGSGPHMSQVRV